MPGHHSLIAQLADDRRSETYRVASNRSPAQRQPSRRAVRADSARNRAGWFLIGVGLRIATTGRHDAMRVTTLVS